MDGCPYKLAEMRAQCPHPTAYRGLSEEWADKQTEEMRSATEDLKREPGWGLKDRAAKEAKERRERIATAVLAGLYSSGSNRMTDGRGVEISNPTQKDAARAAVLAADALIAELDK